MKKLRSIIQYECVTSFKYIWLFYGIELLAVALISGIVMAATGNIRQLTVSCLETNTIIYVGVLGILGFKEDFKMMIQNGFTRRYIFIATLSMFGFISGIMALVDTIIGNVLNRILYGYTLMVPGIYGQNHILWNWIFLFLLYVMICVFLYLLILVINKAGKKLAICLGVLSGFAVLLVIASFQYILPKKLAMGILDFLVNAMGFLNDGTINIFFPVLTMLVLIGVFAGCAYALIRNTELK